MTISAADKQAIADRWAEILNTGAMPYMAPRALAPIDVKKDFCENWPTAKQVLQALQSLVPQPGPLIIGLIIALGDAAASRLCGAGK